MVSVISASVELDDECIAFFLVTFVVFLTLKLCSIAHDTLQHIFANSDMSVRFGFPTTVSVCRPICVWYTSSFPSPIGYTIYGVCALVLQTSHVDDVIVSMCNSFHLQSSISYVCSLFSGIPGGRCGGDEGLALVSVFGLSDG